MPVLYAPRVPSSGVFLDSEINGVEEFAPHWLKSDGGVVSSSAQISALEARGWADANTVTGEAQVSAVEAYGITTTTAGTVTMHAVISGVALHEYSDNGVVSLVSVIGAELDTEGVVTLTSVISGADAHASTDTGTVTLTTVVTSSDTREYPGDSATVTMVAHADYDHDDAHGAVDAGTATMVGAITTVERYWAKDSATVPMIGIASGVNTHEFGPDIGTALVIGIASAVDLKAKWYVDAAVAKTTGIPSSLEDYTHHWDDNAVARVIGVPSAPEDEYTSESAIFYEAVTPPGDDITIEYVDPHAALQALTTLTTGTAIQVFLATDADGIPTSTDDDILALIQGDMDASALVNTTIVGSGTGIAVAFAPRALGIV